ncbi:hypothetical protein PGT21_034352 [Puccinia graminis f. sp. tritici]|uniref:Uncharacterized protein n=1 Tax=Puccinia graminis f. sp. tritici TaxID=56615 RepID=A0A5B0MGP2_PUCGR|nr:hypothetical protein PGT21_034352 [Puccinia graminis f. sp. tritici]
MQEVVLLGRRYVKLIKQNTKESESMHTGNRWVHLDSEGFLSAIDYQDERINEISARTLLHNAKAFKATEAFLQISARLPQFRRREDAEGTHQ